jgi:hypothetical protein
MVVEYVDNLLKKLTGNAELKRDLDGDWPFNLKSSVMFVRVTADPEPVVRVWGVAAKEVPATAELFSLLNDINQQVQFSRAFWAKEGTVFIATELVGESIDLEELDTALRRVASGTEFFGPKVVEACGRELVDPPQPPAPAAPSASERSTSGQPSASGATVAPRPEGPVPTGGYL